MMIKVFKVFKVLKVLKVKCQKKTNFLLAFYLKDFKDSKDLIDLNHPLYHSFTSVF